MIKLALIGKNISHSQSPMIYQKLIKEKFSYDLLDYDNEGEIPTLKNLFNKYDGINITAPYKKHFLDQIDLNLSPIAAINVIKHSGGQFSAQNTDYIAVGEIVENYLNKSAIHFVVLGDGVMAKLLLKVLEEKNVAFTQCSRRGNNLTQAMGYIKPNYSTVVVNCCARDYTFDFKGEKSDFYFWDMNYNLDKHNQLFKTSKVDYIDGIELLKLQAIYALSFWNFKTN